MAAHFGNLQTTAYSCASACALYLLDRFHPNHGSSEDAISGQLGANPDTGVDNDTLGGFLDQHLATTILHPGNINNIREALRLGAFVVLNFLIMEQGGPRVDQHGRYLELSQNGPHDGHYAVAISSTDTGFVMFDPALQSTVIMSHGELSRRWRANYTHHERWMAIIRGVK